MASADGWTRGRTGVADLRARAAEHAYNLDHEQAVALYRQALALDPNDAATHRALASIIWLNVLFSRGAITVEEYMGSTSTATVAVQKPPAEQASEFARHSARARALAEQLVARNPRSAEAHFQLGSVVGLQAAYSATVDGKLLAGFRAARLAFDEHERVLQLDPSRADAGLAVGTYRYVISTMSWPMRWMAYVAGFGGDGRLGLRLVEAAAAYRGDNQVDAKFALVLLYNRERRYADALAVLADLRARYPRNRLLWLEAGATAIRGKRAAEADVFLTDGIARLAGDSRPRGFGEEAMWYYKRGLARLMLRRRADAAADLRLALAAPSRDWVKGRVHLALGKAADLSGDRVEAKASYEAAILLAKRGEDPMVESEARILLRQPYR
jgi:tetratricopeptide (TPR) repeat protein